MEEKTKVTADALRDIPMGGSKEFANLTASEIDSGKVMATVYGRRYEVRLSCESNYDQGTLTITKNPR